MTHLTHRLRPRRQRSVLTAALLLWMGVTGGAIAQLPTPAAVEEAIRRANDYFIENNAIGQVNWNRGAYQTGNFEAWRVLGETRYRERALDWGNAATWQLGSPFGGWNHRLHADSQVAGQVYLDLYRETGNSTHRAAPAQVAQELLDDQSWNDGRSDTIDNLSADDWWWIDAYYMAAPMLAKLADIDGVEAHRTKLRQMYDWMKDTRDLFDETEGLWYRDAASKSEISANGEKVFWSRGNGWVIAGLVRVLDELPPGHPDRAEFESMLQTMAAALVPLQGADGFWRSNLLDAAHYPNPETSGTAFFTAAMAWGIRNGVLDAATYQPVVEKAWDGLVTTALQPSGLVGYIQNVGRAPASAGANESHDFGMGAYLLAGAEMLRLVGGAAPVLPLAGPDQTQMAGENEYEAVFTLDGSGTQVREGSLEQATWWVGDIFLAGGLVAQVTLPRGSHTITLQLEHSGGGVFFDTTHASLAAAGGLEAEVVATGASTFQSPNVPDNTRDGDLLSRWSAQGIGQWIQFDLGTAQDIASVDIAFYLGDQRTSSFDLEFSVNGVDWQTVLDGVASSGTTLDLESFQTGGHSARYVRYTGLGNSESDWNSLTEVVIRRSQPAMAVESVTASEFQESNTPGNTRDDDLITRWSAEGSGQWIQYDLGSVRNIASVDIAFYLGDERTSSFNLEFSADGAGWQTVLAGAVSSGTTLDLESFPTIGHSARYVRYTGLGNSQSDWNSLTEVVIREDQTPPDADGDDVPDAWEIARLGSSAGDPAVLDSDGDGFVDELEYEAGTDPADSSDRPLLQVEASGSEGMLRLSFSARAAFGAGYTSMERVYTLEFSSDLSPGSWQPLAGQGPFTGRNLPIEVDVPTDAARGFFRLSTELVEE